MRRDFLVVFLLCLDESISFDDSSSCHKICVVRITELLKALYVCQGKKQMHYGIFQGRKITALHSGKSSVLFCVTLDESGKHFLNIILLSISIVFCILAAVLTTRSCFASSLVNSFIVFFMPSPRAPIMTGTIVAVYPGLLSLVSKASCRYCTSLSLRFVSIFCCWDISCRTSKPASRLSFRVSSWVFLLSRFFVV